MGGTPSRADTQWSQDARVCPGVRPQVHVATLHGQVGQGEPDKCTKLEELKHYIKATISLQREHFFAGGISNTGVPPPRSSTAAPRDKDGDVPMPQAHQVQAEGMVPLNGEHDSGEHPTPDGEGQDAFGIWKINGACRGCGV